MKQNDVDDDDANEDGMNTHTDTRSSVQILPHVRRVRISN